MIVAARFAYYMSTCDRYDWNRKRADIWALAVACTLLWPVLLIRPRPLLNPREVVDPLGLAGITRRIELNLDDADEDDDPKSKAIALSNAVLNELARRLERTGFARERGMFFRDHDGFTERYYLSGGPGVWAEPEPYRLHAGIRIEGIPPIPDWKGFGAYVHAMGDAAAIAPGSPVLFPVPTKRTAKRVAKEVARAILVVSDRLPALVPAVRARAEFGVGSSLPVETASR